MMREPLEDIRTTAENHKLLALTETPVWSVFVRMVDEDMKRLDNISSLVLDGKTKDQIADEVMLRYQTRESVINYINETIERAEMALTENQEPRSDIVKFHDQPL